jgi:hypothetical protein
MYLQGLLLFGVNRKLLAIRIDRIGGTF